jgi:uncharacterized protein (TIGR02452 family)
MKTVDCTIEQNENDKNIYQRRVDIWLDTEKIIENYKTPPSHVIEYDPKYQFRQTFTSTKVEITEEDTIEAGERLSLFHLNPLLLNFSDDVFPGGYLLSGSGAQEESIFRRSDYANTLTSNFYPMASDVCVYSPDVTIIKKCEEDDWLPREPPLHFAFVACPALKRPRCVDDKLCERDSNIFLNKILLIFQAAEKNGHDSLVLGAWGCGVWSSPPLCVAELFKKALTICDKAFEHVVFAIKKSPETYEKPKFSGAFDIFSEVLK